MKKVLLFAILVVGCNCADRFEYNTEKTDTAKYIQLAPLDYTPQKTRGSEDIVINNAHLFWQAPQ